MVLEYLDVRLRRDGGKQGPLDFPPRHVLRVQNAALGMPAFPPQIQLPLPGDFALGELHPRFHQLGDPRRPFLDDGARHLFVAQPGPGRQRVAHVHFHRVLLAGDGGDAALRVIGIGLRARFLGDNRHPSQRRDLQGEGKPRNAAAEHKEIEVLHQLPSMKPQKPAKSELESLRPRRFLGGFRLLPDILDPTLNLNPNLNLIINPVARRSGLRLRLSARAGLV